MPAEATKTIAASGPLHVRRLEPNVLKLDFVDITAGDESRQNVYFYRANQLAWEQNGLPRNPWDSAVQYQDELISKSFAPDSGFEVTYRFTIDGAVARYTFSTAPAVLKIPLFVFDFPAFLPLAKGGE